MQCSLYRDYVELALGIGSVSCLETIQDLSEYKLTHSLAVKLLNNEWSTYNCVTHNQTIYSVFCWSVIALDIRLQASGYRERGDALASDDGAGEALDDDDDELSQHLRQSHEHARRCFIEYKTLSHFPCAILLYPSLAGCRVTHTNSVKCHQPSPCSGTML